jgi:hypothetical protein
MPPGDAVKLRYAICGSISICMPAKWNWKKHMVCTRTSRKKCFLKETCAKPRNLKRLIFRLFSDMSGRDSLSMVQPDIHNLLLLKTYLMASLFLLFLQECMESATLLLVPYFIGNKSYQCVEIGGILPMQRSLFIDNGTDWAHDIA